MTNDSGNILTTLVSDKEVTTINATPSVTVITTRDRETGKVSTQIFYGRNPLVIVDKDKRATRWELYRTIRELRKENERLEKQVMLLVEEVG